MNIIFAGTPDIARGVLETLIEAKYNVIACLTQPDRPQGRGLKILPSPVKLCAQQHNIPILQPNSLKSAEIQQQIRELNADLMVVLAYGLILPSAVLSIPKFGCINIHASILPRWRGAAPIQHAILNGDSESGITTMQMDAGLDTGDILGVYPCQLSINDTSQDLHDRLAKLAKTAILDTLQKLAAGKINPIQQDNSLATYAHKIEKNHAMLDWQKDAASIDRLIRAYNPVPGAFTSYNQQTIKIWRAELIDATPDQSAGTILTADKQHGLLVATGQGILKILELQLPGKKRVQVQEILNAHYFKPGSSFN